MLKKKGFPKKVIKLLEICDSIKKDKDRGFKSYRKKKRFWHKNYRFKFIAKKNKKKHYAFENKLLLILLN